MFVNKTKETEKAVNDVLEISDFLILLNSLSDFFVCISDFFL